MESTHAIQVQNVSFGYNGGMLLKDMTFSLAAGELVALIGPNGSGKTTLLKIMLGLLAPISGTISLNGQPLSSYPLKARAKVIAYVSQQPELSFPLVVQELVSLGRYPHNPRGRISNDDRLTVENALRNTDSVDLRERNFNTLSGGEKQKVLIARALAQSARILLLDEPTLHLDLRYQLQILAALKRLCRQQRATVVTVLHDVNLISLFADKALLLDAGKLRAIGSVHEVVTEDQIKEVLAVDVKMMLDPESGVRYFLPRVPS
jgi:iron complex transport system ATP-binding protein